MSRFKCVNKVCEGKVEQRHNCPEDLDVFRRGIRTPFQG
jgi:hypothetical protein